jgi:hypothetical protein
MLTFLTPPAPEVDGAANVAHLHLAAVVAPHTLRIRNFDALAASNDRVSSFLLNKSVSTHAAHKTKESTRSPPLSDLARIDEKGGGLTVISVWQLVSEYAMQFVPYVPSPETCRLVKES